MEPFMNDSIVYVEIMAAHSQCLGNKNIIIYIFIVNKTIQLHMIWNDMNMVVQVILMWPYKISDDKMVSIMDVCTISVDIKLIITSQQK